MLFLSLWLWFTIFSPLSHSEKTLQFLINYFLHYLFQSIGIILKKVVQTRPAYVQGTFQKAQYITLLERGTKVRRMCSTTCVRISRSDSAAVGTSLIQNNPDCSARDKWAYCRAHTLDEKGRICPSGCWVRQSCFAGRVSWVWVSCWRVQLLCAMCCRGSACFIATEGTVPALDVSINCFYCSVWSLA